MLIGALRACYNLLQMNNEQTHLIKVYKLGFRYLCQKITDEPDRIATLTGRVASLESFVNNKDKMISCHEKTIKKLEEKIDQKTHTNDQLFQVGYMSTIMALGVKTKEELPECIATLCDGIHSPGRTPTGLKSKSEAYRFYTEEIQEIARRAESRL
jgi:hypothetical protein